MEGGGRRITVSPRPCCGRRVVAKKKPHRGGAGDGFVNSVKKLQRREICTQRIRGFSITDAQERFRNIRLQVSHQLSYFSIFCLFQFLHVFSNFHPKLVVFVFLKHDRVAIQLNSVFSAIIIKWSIM